MSKLHTTTLSRVKRQTPAEDALIEAYRQAIAENRPARITQGYDRDEIGAWTEVEIWWFHDE